MAVLPPNSLELHRRSLGWTQRELAERARVDASAVCRAERGHYPSANVRMRLAAALDVAISDLWPRNDDAAGATAAKSGGATGAFGRHHT
ncbi:MAG TPA: helix-turn-helix transcriptional regulator [Solirubrobacteraceae bacterium]|jgi:transcriptional regulator with XRE-family HTH domain|nr:helix-turn-helix transcriptional regulator [Solirubrobacteraceae bacterium]